MQGITVNGEGLLDHVGTYTVRVTTPNGEGYIMVNDNELGNVGLYEMQEDTAMIDYTQSYATLSSFLMTYIAAREEETLKLRDYTNQRYKEKKSRPFKYEARDWSEFSKATSESMLTDGHIKAVVECEKSYLEIRNNLTYITKTVMRLERSILILEKAWDTARSLNANNRKSLGG